MDFELTAQQKIDMLVGSKRGIKLEIFNILIRLGLDPDTFDENDLSGFSSVMIAEKERVEALLNSLSMIESKIASLQ